MPKIQENDLLQNLKDVEKVSDSYKIISPWGFRIVDFDGKKVLRPNTPEEYRRIVEAETAKRLSEDEVLRPLCTADGNFCVSTGCKGKPGHCEHTWSNADNAWVCTCIW